MSALPYETAPVAPSSKASERRRSGRFRPTAMLPVRIARGEGIVLDLGLGGLRARHSGAVQLGTRARLTILGEAEPLSLEGEVLASHVVSLGTASTPTLYESRLRFCSMKQQQVEQVARLVAGLRTRDLRRLVANMRGWEDETRIECPPASPERYIRLIRNGDSWNKAWTSRGAQPPDGFVLPDDTDQKDIELLCRTYEQLDSDGRHLIRRMAAAAVEGEV